MSVPLHRTPLQELAHARLLLRVALHAEARCVELDEEYSAALHARDYEAAARASERYWRLREAIRRGHQRVDAIHAGYSPAAAIAAEVARALPARPL